MNKEIVTIGFTQLINHLEAQFNVPYYVTEPTFYYMAIGSANHNQTYPPPEQRHEYPDYVRDYTFNRKVLILIDPQTTIPLKGSEHKLTLINHVVDPFIASGDKNIYEYYHSTDTINGYPKLEIHVIRESICFSQYEQRNLSAITYLHHRYVLANIVNICLINNRSLFLVNAFNGSSNYRLQDEIINLLPLDKQMEIKQQFLFEGTYMSDYGCYYDLSKKENHPIIENGKFYNPGILSIIEYDDELKKIFSSFSPHLSHSSTDSNFFVFNMKKKIMLDIFKYLLRQTLNTDYRFYRQSLNELGEDCNELRPFLRNEMLLIVEKILLPVRPFIDVNVFIETLREKNIYNDEKEIITVINNILSLN